MKTTEQMVQNHCDSSLPTHSATDQLQPCWNVQQQRAPNLATTRTENLTQHILFSGGIADNTTTVPHLPTRRDL